MALHGEVHGKYQTEYHELRAWVFPHIGQVQLRQLQHDLRQKIRKDGHNARNVQIQQAQQGADENKERENHKQQIKRQRRALGSHVMLEIAVCQQHPEAQKSVFRQGIAPHSSVSL